MNSCGQYEHLTGQTLFLGASIVSFNTNMGWGRGSSLTVELIEDKQPISCYSSLGTPTTLPPYPPENVLNPGNPLPHFQNSSVVSTPNHYQTCKNDQCYVDIEGNTYNATTSKTKIVPGKVVYKFDNNELKSYYWIDEDPGFFGNGTKIDINGAYVPTATGDNAFVYDIIGVPVIFKLDNFTFAGLVSSWEKNISATGPVTYTVNIESFDKLLDNSHMIIDEYAGSIFSASSTLYGGPKNYFIPSTSVVHNGSLEKGNLPNVFNVYGFLESFGIEYFGGADKNDDGVSSVLIMRALHALTSAIGGAADDPAAILGNKRMFSPFGRLISRVMSLSNNAIPINTSFASFGIIPPTQLKVQDGTTSKNVFSLDLTEIPNPPSFFRITGNNGIISINDFIRQVTESMGMDYFVTMILTNNNGAIQPILKIKTIDRTKTVPPGQLKTAVRALTLSGLQVTQSSSGQEANQNSSRVMYIGGNQQRLLQVKNYRLSYSQASYVYHPALKKFVDYHRFNNGSGKGKVRMPLYLSTRNPAVSNIVNSGLSALWNDEEVIAASVRGAAVGATDTNWKDTEIVAGGVIPEAITHGNYLPTFKDITLDTANNQTVRFIPLFEDTICPFFGYKLDNKIELPTATSSNIFRSVRPVWLDKWTGQLSVYFEMNELPILSIGSGISLYDPNVFGTPAASGNAGAGLTRGTPVSQNDKKPALPPASGVSSTGINPTDTNTAKSFGFMVTETEFRAAMAGVDSYLSYCLGKSKSTKPDLFTMLVNAYKAKGIFLDNRSPNTTADASVGAGLNRNGPKPPSTIGQAGQPSTAKSATKTKLDMNWDLYLNNEFIKDFAIITAFVSSIANKYYGKQYLITLPSINAYRDSEYTTTFSINNIKAYAFTGTGKIFYNYELADGAWEEPYNTIDDCILVGSDQFLNLCDDRGLIPPLLGYNASDNVDYVRKLWCDLSFADIIAQLGKSMPNGTGLQDKKNRTLVSNTIAQTSAAAGVECGNPANFYIPSLDLSTLQDYVEMTGVQRSNAWNSTHPGNFASKKIYKKANAVEIAFLDPSTFSAPKAILSTEPIYLKNTSYAYASDPNLTVLSNIALEDTMIYLKLKGAVLDKPTLTPREQQYFQYMMSFVSPIVDTNKLIKEGNTSNQSSSMQTIKPKVAHPFFAGVPLKSNQFCYGPWTNYPVLDSGTIIGGTSRVGKFVLENMVDSVKIEKRNDWVPWNYGGVSYLDKAVMLELADSVDYQSVLEMGSVTIKGTPIFEPGGMFGALITGIPSGQRCHAIVAPTIGAINLIQNNSKYNILQNIVSLPDFKVNWPAISASAAARTYGLNTFNSGYINYNIILASSHPPIAISGYGPIITNMSMNVGVDGITTTYSFRTYSRKAGIWNKEGVDRIKKQNSANLKFSKLFSNSTNNSIIKSKQDIQAILDSSSNRSGPASLAGYESKLFGSSPTELLIGQSRPITKSNIFGIHRMIDSSGRLGTAEPNASVGTAAVTDARTLTDPGFKFSYGSDPGDDSSHFSRWSANAVSGTMETTRKSTWVGMYMADEVGAELVKEYNTKAAMSLDGIFSPVSFYPTNWGSTYAMSSYKNQSGIFCPQCKGSGYIYDIFVNPANPVETNEKFPCPCCSKGRPKVTGDITVYGLNPIVVPYGEFRNPYAQNSGNSVDRCRHSIGVVARGEYNQVADQSFYITSNLDKYVDPNTGFAVSPTGGTGVLADYYEYDIFKKRAEGDAHKTPLNHRFFAFRGPLMLHGWGYDVDGYPVPNAADEPREYDAYGRPKRFIKKADGTNDLEKDGAFLPSGNDTLGDIIGKGWEKKGGKWERNRKKFFHLNWAEKPDTWPVGPIDLRWDDKRKVWDAGGGCGEIEPPYIVASGTDAAVLEEFTTVSKTSKNCPYKLKYVVLEENLIKIDGVDETYPARGFLDDLDYSLEPLPLNTRKLIYIKDRCGYTAPRGAKLLCRYDRDTGFYEPVTKQQYIVFGQITSGTNAIIDLTYIQGIRSPTNIPKIPIVFDNTRFNFSVSGKRKGMFMFENGSWILIGTN